MGPPLLDINSPVSSIRAQWARQHAIYGIKEEWNKIVRLAYGRPPNDKSFDVPELIKGDTLGEAPLKMQPRDGTAGGDPLAINVGIVGAGAAGLFSALVLEYLNTAQTSVKFTYDILEADTTKRSGGRLYTHNFSQQPHDYYDVGAMRFPNHAVMTRYGMHPSLLLFCSNMTVVLQHLLSLYEAWHGLWVTRPQWQLGE